MLSGCRLWCVPADMHPNMSSSDRYRTPLTPVVLAAVFAAMLLFTFMGLAIVLCKKKRRTKTSPGPRTGQLAYAWSLLGAHTPRPSGYQSFAPKKGGVQHAWGPQAAPEPHPGRQRGDSPGVFPGAQRLLPCPFLPGSQMSTRRAHCPIRDFPFPSILHHLLLFL